MIGPLFLLGMAWFNDWHSAFYVPAAAALFVAVFAFLTMRDTPQSEGLPPIEEWKNDYPPDYSEESEVELTAKEIFTKYILNNRLLWMIAFANVFVYLIRYGVLDWAPTYLKEAKGFAIDESSWAYFFYEWAGIPGTLLCGWVSDRVFGGRRAPAGVLFMVLVLVAVLVYWLNPIQHDHRHDRPDFYRLPDLWSRHVDRPARPRAGSQESSWNSSRLYRLVRLSRRLCCCKRSPRLHG